MNSKKEKKIMNNRHPRQSIYQVPEIAAFVKLFGHEYSPRRPASRIGKVTQRWHMGALGPEIPKW